MFLSIGCLVFVIRISSIDSFIFVFLFANDLNIFLIGFNDDVLIYEMFFDLKPVIIWFNKKKFH